jgi:hypothetical protein
MTGRKSALMGFRLDEIERRLLTALSLLHELKAEGDQAAGRAWLHGDSTK